VDDDLSVRKALERLLRAAGFDVVIFASAHELFYFLETHHIGCLVLDLHMPGMNGLEVQRRLSQCGYRVPVIVVTGHDEPQSRSQCLSAGAAAYFAKPLDDKALLGAIEAAMTANAERRC
jgi:FixJ family two-component response regulator